MATGTRGTRKELTRRWFLGSVAAAAGLSAAGALLAACAAPPAPTATPAPAPAAAPAAKPAEAPKAAEAPKPAAAAPAPAGGKKMTAWQIKMFTLSANDLSKEQITKYAKEKGWEVEISDLPTDLMAKLMAGLESGDVPDLIQLSGEVPQLFASDALVDVSPTVKELEAANGTAIKLQQNGAMFKGKWWGIPWFQYADAWFIRRDVLQKAGIKVEDLKTYEQRRDAALQVSDPAAEMWGWGITPKAATGDGDIFARHVFNSWGGSITDESGEKVKIDTPEAVEAVKFAVDVYTNKKYEKMLPPGVLGWTGSSNNENYLGGKIAFTHNASSVYWAAKNQKSKFYEVTAVVAFPAGPKVQLDGGYPYYHLTFKKAKNREIAVEIGKFMSENKQVFDRMKIAEGQSWPVFQKQLEAPEVKDFIKTDPGYEQLLKNSTHASGWMVGWPSQPNAGISAVESRNLLAKMFEAAISGKMKPEEAVKDTHKQAVDIFKDFGFKQ